MDFNILKEQYTEVETLRTESSKTFDKGGGSFTLAASRRPIHYKDGGGLYQEIDLNIVNDKIEKNIYRVELLKDKIGYSIVSRRDGSRIDVKLDKIGDTIIHYTIPTTISGNVATWEDIDKDVDFNIEFRAYRVRCWKKLKTKDASKEITFTVIEDDCEKELSVVEQIVGYDTTNKPTIQSQDKSIESKYITEFSKKEVKEYQLTQTFDEKVIVKDSQTRVKSESTDVSYPVMIDADVQVSVGASADDGNDYFQSNIGGSGASFDTTANAGAVISVYDTSYFGAPLTIQNQSFTRFDGITITQGYTIDDATLNLYAGYWVIMQADPDIKVLAFDENDPNAPTTTGDLFNKTTGIAANTAITTFTNSISAGFGTPGDFNLYAVDVSSIVQELVDSYDYSNEAMLFFYRSNTIETTAANLKAGLIYAYDWGTTKAAELVINYSEPSAGYGNDVNTIASANISKVNTIETANISEINGV